MNKYLNHFGLLLIIIFAASYLIFYPSTWLIADVNSYVNQALAFANGKISLTWSDVTGTINLPVRGTQYPLGNASWLSIFIFCLGPKGAFLSGLISVIISAFLIDKVLKQEGFPRWTISIFFLYAPLLFFSRTLMSAMPSLLLVSFFVYLYFKLDDGPKKYFWLAFLAGLSIWFRESNLMICGPLCVWIVWKNHRSILYMGLGFLVGISFRLISSWWVYDDPFFYILAETFSIEALASNAQVYLILMTVIIPGAWIFNFYRGRYKVELISTIWILLCFYLLYDFNAISYSGFGKGVILTGRFLIPATPIIVIAMAGAIARFRPVFRSHLFSIAMLVCTGAVIVTSQYFGYLEHKKHKEVIETISNYKDGVLIYDTKNYTNINRYLNAYNGFPERAADIRMLGDRPYIHSILDIYGEAKILESWNTGGFEKNKRTSELHQYIEEAKTDFEINEVNTISVSDGMEIKVYSISQ